MYLQMKYGGPFRLYSHDNRRARTRPEQRRDCRDAAQAHCLHNISAFVTLIPERFATIYRRLAKFASVRSGANPITSPWTKSESIV
jgi:hypothetical protein